MYRLKDTVGRLKVMPARTEPRLANPEALGCVRDSILTMPPDIGRCLKCDKTWPRNSDTASEPCPGCGDSEWAEEYDLEKTLGARNEYYVSGERINDTGLLMTLELRGSWNRDATAQAPLCHRLKSYYRHAKGDLGVKDGRELMVSFDRLPGDSGGRWGMRVRRQEPWEARRLITDRCRRHQWAIGVHLGGTSPNGFANREHCSCPPEPACEVCTMAAKFAEDRRRPGSDGTRYWTDLQHAVMRDLGKMA
jgi:hypothetical protein